MKIRWKASRIIGKDLSILVGNSGEWLFHVVPQLMIGRSEPEGTT